MDKKTRFLNACRGKDVDRTPVWFMRQAGRIFPDYRELREEHSFMEICHSPELTSQVTRMPVERLDVDAAIIFADIMFPLDVIGKEFELVKGKGPVIADPIREPSDVRDLDIGDTEAILDFFREAIVKTRSDLPDSVPLIGFAGAPFTLACYLIEGTTSRDFNRAKQFMLTHPKPFHVLMRILTDTLNDYIELQIEAGIDVFQLFDSWIGIVSPHHYRQHIQQHVSTIFQEIRNTVPSIYFGTETSSLLHSMGKTGPDVMGVDWRTELTKAQGRIDRDIPLQGNLDPSLMLAPYERITPQLDRLLSQADSLPGHLFNLGHGFHPDTPLDTIKRVVDYVRESTLQSEVSGTTR